MKKFEKETLLRVFYYASYHAHEARAAYLEAAKENKDGTTIVELHEKMTALEAQRLTLYSLIDTFYCAELGKKTELDIKEMHTARDMLDRIDEMDASQNAEHSPKVLNRIIKTVDVEDDDEVRAS